MEFKKLLFKNIWIELIILGIANIALFCFIAVGYGLSNKLPSLLLFMVFLVGVIFYTYQRRFESFRFDLSKKGKFLIFVRACMPYILTTLFFSQCALLISWILFNMGQARILK
jgi:hypothetical protein